jgi:hypothetical protein
MGIFSKTAPPVAPHAHIPPSKPTAQAKPAVSIPAPNAPKAATPAPVTHVLVPVGTLQAMHATLAGHADAILALLPTTTPEAIEAALAAATESRLKQQAAAGK